MRHPRFAARLLLLLAMTALSVWAAQSISGKYKGIQGRTFVVTDKGDTIEIKPDLSAHQLPTEVKAAAQSLLLTGSLTRKPHDAFAFEAKGSKKYEPTPQSKIDVRATLQAEGAPTTRGLHMEECEWKLTFIIFAEGEIAGSEQHTQKCVGMWQKN